MKVMVTGAGGMLAHAVIPALRSAGHEVLALTHAEADVTRLESLRSPARAFRPDWIAHFAAFTHVDACEREPDRAFVVNGLGPRNASLAAADVGAAVLALSTDYVFDGATPAPRREHDIPGPLNVYGRSKLAGERGAREVNARHVIVRTSWLYGPGGRNFVDTILAAARAGQALRVVDDQRGSPTYTADLAGALAGLIERGEFGTYHVTNRGDCTWHELAVEACRLGGIDAPVAAITSAELSRPARRPAFSVLSNVWYEHVTGRPLPPWRDALARHLSGVAPRKEG